MKISVYIKIAVLFIALAAVLYTMKTLNSGSVEKALDTIGANPTDTGHINLCKTRLHGFKWYDGRRIEEVKGDGARSKWVVFDPSERELNYLSMEKWLSEHCQISGQPLTQEEIRNMITRSFIALQYIDGSEIEIFRSDDNIFNIDKSMIRSDQLRDGLTELATLAGLNPAP